MTDQVCSIWLPISILKYRGQTGDWLSVDAE
jgi:hypothetical protein